MPRVIEAFSQFFDGEGNPLIEGKLKFTISGTNGTDKDTYADVNETVLNTNPVLLDAEGRAPSIFGTGSYRATLYDSLGQQIDQFDPIPATNIQSQFVNWNAYSIYSIPDVVLGDDLKMYRSLVNSNRGNDPTVVSANWEYVDFRLFYNQFRTYAESDQCVDSLGDTYVSLVDNNLGNEPSESPEWSFQTSRLPLETVADLQAISYIPNDGEDVTLLGYYNYGDGGGSSMYWDASSTITPNNITSFALSPDSGTGRWIRVYSGNLKAEYAGVIADGTTDNTVKLNALANLQVSVDFPPGIIGYSALVSFNFGGQEYRGISSRGTNVGETIFPGTVFKRLSGTVSPCVQFVGDYGSLSNITFDNDNAAADHVLITAHGLNVSKLTCINQGANSFKALTLNSINTSQYSDIKVPNILIENNSLYTDFYNLYVVPENTTTHSMIMDEVEKCNFYGGNIVNPVSGNTIRMSTYVINCHFYGLKGETEVNGLADSYVKTVTGGTYFNISFDGFEFSQSFTTVSPMFELTSVANFGLSNVYLPNNTAPVDSVIIQSIGSSQITLKNIKTNYDDDHYLIKATSTTTDVIIENCITGPRTGTAKIELFGNRNKICGSNMDVSFAGSSGFNTLENVSGAIDLTNTTQNNLINCAIPTNIPSSTSRIYNGYVVAGIATVASATSITIDYGSVITITGTTSISSIAGGSSIPGRTVKLMFTGILTVTDGSNLKLAGNFVTAADSTLVLTCHADSNWYEDSRSTN